MLLVVLSETRCCVGLGYFIYCFTPGSKILASTQHVLHKQNGRGGAREARPRRPIICCGRRICSDEMCVGPCAKHTKYNLFYRYRTYIQTVKIV